MQNKIHHAGFHLKTRGDYTIFENILPAGWGFYHETNRVLAVSLDGSNVNGSLEFVFDGNLEVVHGIAADWIRLLTDKCNWVISPRLLKIRHLAWRRNGK